MPYASYEKIGYYRNSLPDEPSHLWEFWGLEGYRSLCEGFEMGRAYLHEVDFVECAQCIRVCMREYEGGADLEDVKLSGLEPEMTEEEYRRLFNLARTSKDLVTELADDMKAITVTGLAFHEMTLEQKTDHIEFLNRCMRKIKIFKSSATLARQEAIMALNEAEQKEAREYARKYVPKAQGVTATKSSPGERKAPQSPEDKLIAMLEKQLGSREAALSFIASQRAAKK